MFRAVDFLLYCFITAYTPGVNNLLSMNYAAKYGFRRSFPFNLGVAAGFFAVMVLCCFFTSYLYALIPSAKPVLQILGAGYMLYLAWMVLRSSSHSIDEKHGAAFRSGALLQFINVKIYIYAITAVSLYIIPAFGDGVEVMLISPVILTVIGASGTFAWAFFGNVFSSFASRHERAVSIVMAILLVYCAVSLFL